MVLIIKPQNPKTPWWRNVVNLLIIKLKWNILVSLCSLEPLPPLDSLVITTISWLILLKTLQASKLLKKRTERSLCSISTESQLLQWASNSPLQIKAIRDQMDLWQRLPESNTTKDFTMLSESVVKSKLDAC